MYDRILVPVDGSEPATAALEHALAIADDVDATVRVLNVADTNEPSATRIGGDVVDVLEREGEEIVSGARSRGDDYSVSVVDDVIQGDPREVIVEYVDEYGIDLVAMGAHGRQGLAEYVLGSVTDHVVNRSDAPVLTVRATDDVTVSYPYDDVLVPTDGSEHAMAALEAGAGIANWNGATLHLLSVVDEPSVGLGARPSLVTDRLEETAREVVDEARAAAEEAIVGDVVTTVEFGSVAEKIRSYAASEGVDLVVMGTHGRSGLDRHLLGSITERVLRTAPAPVLTTRLRNG